MHPLLRPGWRQVVVHYSGVQTADSVHMCTVLFSLAQKVNEKKALALLELSSRFHDFYRISRGYPQWNSSSNEGHLPQD